MKKNYLMPVMTSLLGAVVFVVLAFVNLKSTGTEFVQSIMIIPVAIGLVFGFILGSTRKKWQEKTKEVEKATVALEKKLEEVRSQKDITENLLRMVENIPLPVYLKDQNHRYLLANGEYQKLTGKAFTEIDGKTDFDIFPQPIAELFREQDEEVVTEKTNKTFEETVPLPAGIVTFQTFKFPLVDDKGNIYAVGGICTDITGLKNAEDSLASQRERMNVVLSHIDEAVIAADCDEMVVMFNRKAAELTGYSPTQAEGRTLESVYKTQDPITGVEEKFWLEKDGQRKTKEDGERKVVLTTGADQSLTIKQKTVTLRDRFSQNMGILILFSALEKNRAGAREPLKHDSKIETPVPEIKSAQSEKGKELNQTNIMVMDDDPLVRKTCALMLASVGYTALQTENGEEAVAMYLKLMSSDNPVRVVIMDLTVPGAMGGVEASAEILEMDPEARIIVASGYSNDPVMANFKEYGFRARVEKPFAVQKLLTTVQDLFED